MSVIVTDSGFGPDDFTGEILDLASDTAPEAPVRNPVSRLPSITQVSAPLDPSKSSTVPMPLGRPKRPGLSRNPPEEALSDTSSPLRW